MTILQIRRKAISKIIQKEIKDFIAVVLQNHDKYERQCATCGKWFIAKMRWHFFCKAGCRKEFYRGQFKPRD